MTRRKPVKAGSSPARFVAKLEQLRFKLMQPNTHLEQDSARLRAEMDRLGKENYQLEQQLAAARNNSSTAAKPPRQGSGLDI